MLPNFRHGIQVGFIENAVSQVSSPYNKAVDYIPKKNNAYTQCIFHVLKLRCISLYTLQLT